MSRVTREAPLPAQMLGRWVEADDFSSELTIVGGEVACFGAIVDYDYKEIVNEGGALVVSLGVDDQSRFDTGANFRASALANSRTRRRSGPSLSPRAVRSTGSANSVKAPASLVVSRVSQPHCIQFLFYR